MFLTVAIVESISRITQHGGYEARELIFYARSFEIIVWGSIWGFRSKKEWVKDLTLSFTSATVLLFVIDFIFFIIIVIKTPAHEPEVYPPAASISIPDPEIGYKSITDTNLHVI